jgi:hypothetical protein
MYDTCRMLEPSKRQEYLCLDCEEQFDNGTKAEMLSRLRAYAEDCAEEDRARRGGRAGRVELSLKGKARNAIVDDGLFDGYDDGKEEARATSTMRRGRQQGEEEGGGVHRPRPPPLLPTQR